MLRAVAPWLFGCSDRGGYRGQINGVAVYHCGLQSHAAACLAACEVADRAGRVGPGDHDDLAEDVTRGALAGELRERDTIELSSLGCCSPT